MKHKINIIGGDFGNKGYSVHGKESQYVEWVFDGSANETMYIDRGIYSAFNNNKSGIKYAWLLESKDIVHGIAEDIKTNIDKYLNTFKYIFTHNKSLLELGDRFKFVPANGTWIMEPKIYEKSKLISMITSLKRFTIGHQKRHEWINKLAGKVDLYGHGIKSIEHKEEGLCDYMFSIAIENAWYESYYTEKLLDCFATGTIPVYIGPPDIGDYFNKDGIIFLTDDFNIDSLTPELYYSKVDAIKDNLERLKNMNPDSLEDYMYLRYLKIA